VSILNIIRQTKSLRRFGIAKYINKGMLDYILYLYVQLLYLLLPDLMPCITMLIA
jgi:uncharacterized protein YlbG (UPF0298 family)